MENKPRTLKHSNLAKEIIKEGGDIIPIMIPSNETNGLGIMNPSILVEGDEILVNLRNVGYTFFHADYDQKYHSRWGPLTYMHPEDDLNLRTTNFLCKLNTESLEVEAYAEIDTSKLDIPPVWEFIGLEDARLARWGNKLYGIGVRRDVKPNGEGRMEFQEIEYNLDPENHENSYAKEIKRNRIQPPIDKDSYCEKNWMPILEKPFHFVKWSHPTEIVKANLKDNTSTQTHISETSIRLGRDLRGGSQILRWNDRWFGVTHELDPLSHPELNLKDAYYFSRFVIWDDDWNIIEVSEAFSFMGARIEFTTGLAEWKEFFLMTFGYADAAAYTAKVPKKLIEKMLTKVSYE